MKNEVARPSNAGEKSGWSPARVLARPTGRGVCPGFWLAGLVVLAGLPVSGQHFNFAQYAYTPLRVNPALVAADKDAYAIVNFRSQGSTADVRFNTSLVALTYPLLKRGTGRRWGGVGLSVMDDRTGGGMYTSQTAAASFAYNVELGARQSLSLGMQGSYHVRRISTEGLTTGSQYVVGRGYDASVALGEDLSNERLGYLGVSAGAYWYEDGLDHRKTYAGLAIRDFNQPGSFSGHPAVPTLIIHAGRRVYENDRVTLSPELLFTRSAGIHLLNVGVTVGYDLDTRSASPTGRMDLAARYVVGKAAILSAQFVQAHYVVGFSYDLPLSTQPAANTFQGATELVLALKKTIEPGRKKTRKGRKKARRRKKVVRRKKAARKQATPRNARSSPPGQMPRSRSAPPVANEERPEKIDTSGNARPPAAPIAQPFPANAPNPAVRPKAAISTAEREGSLLINRLNQRFEFGFNRTSPSESTRQHLDELATWMRKNPSYHLLITGHTDNVGSEPANRRVAAKRAGNVAGYLAGRGIERARMRAEGQGAANPLLPNDTPERRARNRRVEFALYQK